MTLAQRINAFVMQAATDIKSLNSRMSDLTALTTTEKSNVVGAIVEIQRALSTAGVSVTTVQQMIADARAALKTEILGGASPAYDTLVELQAILQNDESTAAALALAVNKRVSVDGVQNFSVAERLQGCQNLGIGDPDTDFLAAYNAAKA